MSPYPARPGRPNCCATGVGLDKTCRATHSEAAYLFYKLEGLLIFLDVHAARIQEAKQRLKDLRDFAVPRKSSKERGQGPAGASGRGASALRPGCVAAAATETAGRSGANAVVEEQGSGRAARRDARTVNFLPALQPLEKANSNASVEGPGP
eukprot:GHVT01086903.1.p1 GENE.GHVT01086903.1~~GHVT01086903.1.p1  ORF type:complete len:152 (+),score=41.65 GHVT01086903.1:304-759(+)